MNEYYGKCFRLRNVGDQSWAGPGSGLTLVLNTSIYSDPEENHLYSAAKGIQMELIHPGERGKDEFHQIPINKYASVPFQRSKFTTVNVPMMERRCYEDMEHHEHKPSCNQRTWAKELNKSCGCAPYGGLFKLDMLHRNL